MVINWSLVNCGYSSSSDDIVVKGDRILPKLLGRDLIFANDQLAAHQIPSSTSNDDEYNQETNNYEPTLSNEADAPSIGEIYPYYNGENPDFY